ncbi:MAG: hypothetical protein ABI352_12195 [Candidatus Dormibacter sp.]
MTDSIRVLALDHFFDQDLRALEAHPRLDVRRFPYQRLRGPAMRMMGADVASGLQAFARPELAPARRRYAAWLADEVRRLYLERSFDVIVLPTDTLFYVRSLPDAAHALGIPVVVVQKETTISAATMESHSALMRATAPFAADLMTVCSERHREFWLRTGAVGELLVVTGQPRFDIYAAPRLREQRRRQRVLFLTYQLDAYVPGAGSGKGWRTWEPLRGAIETVLLDAVRTGSCEVVVKCHPQQDQRSEAARLSRRAGAMWNRGVSVAPIDADTRELIVAADVVVGFQTTALYEAVAARRSVVYAAWGEAYERFREKLIRFDEAPAGCLEHAGSTEQLAAALANPTTPADATCAGWYEEALGAVDGHATERVAERLAAVAAAWPPGAARAGLESHRRHFAAGLLARSLAAEAVWTVAVPVARVAGEQRRVAIRRRRAREGRALATAALLGRRPRSGDRVSPGAG